MGKGGGGSIDTSGLEKATNRAIDLQEEIFNLTREDVQPWYNMGVGAVGRLSDLLGVSGGTVQSRDSVYNELLPQYQTQSEPIYSDMFVTPDGNVVSLDGAINSMPSGMGSRGHKLNIARDHGGDDAAIDLLLDYGFERQGSAPTTMTDYNALNAAVDDRMAGMTTPDDYGSLLNKFTLEDFEADPSYQFRQDEAQKALERQMAAQGVTLGGAGAGEINPQAYRAMNELTQNLASQEYNNAYNRYTQDQLNTYNMLMGAAGMGQGSTGILATGGQNYANNVGNLTTGLASAQLNAQMAGQAQQSSMFGSLLGTAGQLGGAYLMTAS